MTLPPVLLLHGFGTSAARTWGDNGWLDLLAEEGREVVAPDLLGHGTNAKPHDPDAYGALESGVLDALPDGPVDAVGFSLGARVVLTLAAAHPERFRRIVVAGVGANLFRTGQSPLAEGADPDDPTVGYFAHLIAQPGNDPEALHALVGSSRPPLDEAMLARIDCPVLVVLGDQDFAGPADPLVAALPNPTFVPLRNVDHFATPKAMGFLDAALRFLQ